MREIVGERVIHSGSFGTGKVVSIVDDKYLTVDFGSKIGEKQFVYPDSFERFLRFADATLQNNVELDIAVAKQKKQEEIRQREENIIREEEAKREQKKERDSRYKDHSIWFKFEGKQNGKQIHEMVSVQENGKTLYILNYSRPVTVKADDEVFMVAGIEDDKGKVNQVIIGRGVIGSSNTNTVEASWIKKYSWMDKFKYYSVLDEFEMLNTVRERGIPLINVINELGADTYVASQGEVRELSALRKLHSRRSHMRITFEARDYVNAEFDKIAQNTGTIVYRSEH